MARGFQQFAVVLAVVWLTTTAACTTDPVPSTASGPGETQIDDGKFDEANGTGTNANGTGTNANDPSTPIGEVDRETWVQGEIADWNGWLSESDRAAKYEKMAESAFIFFRGTNHVYWADLAEDPRLSTYASDETNIWLQGDAHTENFGAFHNDDGDIVFDLNDFDESLIANYQLDLWRVATAIVLVGRENGFSNGDIHGFIDAFIESYLDTLADYVDNNDERDRIFTANNTYGRLDNFLEDVEDSESREEMLDKWTVVGGSERLFDLSSSKLEAVDDTLYAALEEAFLGYGETLSGGLDFDSDYFAIKHIARRLLAGTGSLGTPRFYILIEGPSDATDDDIILDVKRQDYPTAYYFGDDDLRARYDAAFDNNHAERAVTAQKALLTAVDDHLGWLELADGSYSVRERSPWKDEFPTDELDSTGRFEKLAEQWGLILATDHARSDDDFRDTLIPYSFEAGVDDVTDGNHAEMRDLAWEVASGYADQVLADYTAFLQML